MAVHYKPDNQAEKQYPAQSMCGNKIGFGTKHQQRKAQPGFLNNLIGIWKESPDKQFVPVAF
jgi:hypothetical protein